MNKLNSKTYSFGLNFLELVNKRSIDVAQHQILLGRQLASIDSLRDILKEFKYLKIIKDDPLLLQTELDLLSIKLEIYQKKKGLIPDDNSKDNQNYCGEKLKQENIKIIKTASAPRKTNKLASSKKKILDFIKSYPNTRTKDIVYEFNALSDRTVKRNLTDLLSAGLVKKRIDNKAVYYYASE